MPALAASDTTLADVLLQRPPETAGPLLEAILREPDWAERLLGDNVEIPPALQELRDRVMLVGSEVKSLRGGKSTIAESYAHAKDGELWLVNSYIPEYTQASRFNHEPKRSRKLLVHKREAARLAAAIRALISSRALA